MPRKKFAKPPAYTHHKPSGQAVVRIDGRDTYLGKHGTPESHEAYERAIAEWRAAADSNSADLATKPLHQVTINEVLVEYCKFCQTYYVDPAGETSKEYTSMMHALRPLKRLYGRTLIADFGPKSLKTIQVAMADSGRLSRGVINRRIGRIRRFFKWAVSEELAPTHLHHGLQTVQPLRVGQHGVKDTKPVTAVPIDDIVPVIEAASPQIAAMIQVQLLGGMRPGEVTRMTPGEIDRSEDVWIYQPFHHKNRWRGKDRSPIALGKHCQELLAPFLDRANDAFLFSPAEAESWRNARRREQRKTKMTPSQAKRRRKARPKRAKRDHYDVNSYRRAITYTIDKINRQRKANGEHLLQRWSPLQLRHTRATELRKEYGLEAAQVFLGHTSADVTQVYAERDLSVIHRIANERGGIPH